MPMISIISGSESDLLRSGQLLEAIGKRLHEDLKPWGKSFRVNMEHQPENTVRMISAEGSAGVFHGVMVKVLLSERNDSKFIEELINSLKSSVSGVMELDESAVTVLVRRIEKGCFLINNSII